ncbi:type II toxin-antitoxin system RelE/ParE family toxin [Carboxylicivirga sp. N1Y90]|uniref:type II toxin-antitoxin system RelE/ParE family toxin n=1 Tax=Carboxylicivirga fragile TaxID=3417571 RepID=UPI003D355641|nr:type II toxin-antitoxin system RelE/ParE family toxin [Marinilabiliaceae bacterium N1Y90]
MYELIIKPFAEEDIKDAANWYNGKREGLGNEFLLALEATINAIQRNPNNYQVVYKGLKRALTVRFPYGIFFTVEKDTIYVLAIMHTSRSPKIWKKRK